MSEPVIYETKIKINGMSCKHCVDTIESGIGRLNGVESVKVNLIENKALVRFDPDETDLGAIKSEIKALGYSTDEESDDVEQNNVKMEEVEREEVEEEKREETGGNNMDSVVKNNIIIAAITITLVLTLFNSYTLFQITGKATSATGDNTGSGGIKDAQPLQNPGQPTKVSASAEDDAVLGNSNASVTIIEFSDFECPFCGRFYTETLPLIQENYIKTGKVKLVFRDFPLPFHADAEKAAEAAECAGEQNKYWEMHDKLFENQNALSVDKLKQYAKDIGLDSAQFNSCLDSGKTATEVQKDLTDGQSYGVSGTPTFFINGVEVVGAQPYSAFDQVIKQALSQ